MNITNKKEHLILFLGDIIFFSIALWITLLVRYFDIPDKKILIDHFVPFSFIFIIWILVYFIAGLYEKHTLILRNKLPSVIFNAQIINSILAVLFFYFIPYFGITPKTNLFVYLIISLGLIFFWRVKIVPFIGFKKKEKAILIGSGEEMIELRNEINNNPRYNLEFVSFIDLNKIDNIDDIDFRDEIINRIYSENIKSVVVDLKNPKIKNIFPYLYNLIFSHINFVDIHKAYENIFDRIPLSLVGYSWFLENISSSSNIFYDTLKRLMDILISLFLGIISLILYPFVYLLIKLDDKGPLFFRAERVGKNGQKINLVKFRTMSTKSSGDGLETKPEVTKVGSFLRKTRIDELPQLFNVLKGEMSLIGPRPECPDLVEKYKEEIPYYNTRHLIKPGLSGWAQMYHKNHPHHQIDVDETKVKLSYDLFYVKNRSFVFDLKIALKTIKTLLSVVGK